MKDLREKTPKLDKCRRKQRRIPEFRIELAAVLIPTVLKRNSQTKRKALQSSLIRQLKHQTDTAEEPDNGPCSPRESE